MGVAAGGERYTDRHENPNVNYVEVSSEESDWEEEGPVDEQVHAEMDWVDTASIDVDNVHQGAQILGTPG